MNWIEALILGIIQGLSEFLPVSSSGHLELSKVILGIDAENSLIFTVVVHGATVLSTIIIFRKDIAQIIARFFEFKWNFEMRYVIKIFISMIPVLIIGLFFKDVVEGFFTGNLLIVGTMLLVTAILLAFTYYAKAKEKAITYSDSFVIGIAQALAVMPGISRSGATIATGLLLGNKRENVARFSFLMVLIPIIGANLKDLSEGAATIEGGIGPLPLVIGFMAAFISGLLACRWMIKLVKKGKLVYFAIYCAIVGGTAIGFYFFA